MFGINKYIFIFRGLFSALLILTGIFWGQNVLAATAYFSPASGSFAEGKNFTVNIFVNTKDVAINNAEAVISFPSDLLEVVSVSKSGSIFSLWVEEPTFSNSAGTISFNGGVPTPGYTGAAGKLVGVVFRVKKAGMASLTFSSAAVRANDGLGTDVFTGGGSASLNLTATEKPTIDGEEVPAVPAVVTTLQISSPTHSDSEKWYSNSNPEFVWSLPIGATSVRLLSDNNPNSQPTVVYKPAITEKKLENIGDGVWYLHTQFNSAKGWGDIAHFRFQIDTVKPSKFDINVEKSGQFGITDSSQKDVAWSKARFTFDAEDEISGIGYYEIQIDDGASETWTDGGSGFYETDGGGPGQHILNAKAFDKAGNYLTSSVEFTIEAVAAPAVAGKVPSVGLFTILTKSNIFKVGLWIIELLIVIAVLILLIIVLMSIISFFWYKLLVLRKRLQKEVSEAGTPNRKTETTFVAPKKSVEKQIKTPKKASFKRQPNKRK